MSALNLSFILADGVQELVIAAREYIGVSNPIALEAEPAQTRLENALGQFESHGATLQPEYLRGLMGRVRELEADNEALSGELADMNARAFKAEAFLDAATVMYREGRDLIKEQFDAQVNAPAKRTKRVAA